MAAASALIQAQALPTLLTSRPKLSFVDAGVAKACGEAQPAGVPSKDLLGESGEAEPAHKLPKAYTMSICVRNTFIDTPAELSPSLGRFYREREVSTCPSAHIGRFHRLFQEADGSGWGSDDDADTQLPSDAQETRSASEASPCNAARGGLGNVLLLAEALSPPSQPLQAPEWDGQFGNAFVDSTVVAPEVPYESTFGDCCFSWGEVNALPADCVATDGFFVQVPCDGVFNDWSSSWCEVPPQQGAALDGLCVEGRRAEELPAVGTPPPAATGLGAPAISAPPPPTQPAPGTSDLPSLGSVSHAAGGCKPCAFFHTVGCESGPTCQFCHLCGPEARKLRRKAKMEARRADRQRRRSAAACSEEDPEEAKSVDEGAM
mmetsp:Transcript_38828/g.78340  ORF Transcript_38828/g.78340 Transcript_38828/m.78340 type:complete len:376 (-) Transcript_38828:466-1593(-)